MNLYDVARQVTDEVLGEGSYEEINRHNPNPGVQAAIKKVNCKHTHIWIVDEIRICKDCGESLGEQPPVRKLGPEQGGDR